VKDLTLSEKLAALPYEAKVRICFRLLKTADHLQRATKVDNAPQAAEDSAGRKKQSRLK